jgi:hypothetical protein
MTFSNRKEASQGIGYVLAAAIGHRLGLRELRHSRTDCVKLQLANAAPSIGYVGAVMDDEAAGGSHGPTAFDEGALETLFDGAQVAVVSAGVDDMNGIFMAARIRSASSRFVVIYTEPKNHMAWSRAVKLLTGFAPVIHTVDDDTDISDLAQLSTVMDLRGGRDGH